MADQSPVEPVAGTIASFRSSNPNGKSEQEYQGIFRQAIRQLYNRATTHKKRTFVNRTLSTPHMVPREQISGRDTANQLGQTILPALKEKLRSLPIAMDPSDVKSGSSSWFEAILDILIEIDELLEQIDASIILIRRAWRPYPDKIPSPRHLSHFKSTTITNRTEKLLTGEFLRVLVACDTFFVNFSFSDPSTDRRSITEKWDAVDIRTSRSLGSIDALTQWMQKPMLAVAKEEWQDLVDQLDSLLTSLLKELNPLHPASQQIDILTPTGMKFVRAGIPVVKISRIFFNKLISRSPESQPLIFVGPSMDMEEAELKELLYWTGETLTALYDFTGLISSLPSRRRAVVDSSIHVTGVLLECSMILERYWKNLAESKDPQVDQQVVRGACDWLDFWTPLMHCATGHAWAVTGCHFPWPDPQDEVDTEDDGEFDEGFGLHLGGYGLNFGGEFDDDDGPDDDDDLEEEEDSKDEDESDSGDDSDDEDKSDGEEDSVNEQTTDDHK
ncbi:hypothetical protein PGT21_014441 [Puccinia graminis f. sp. tritici]|uniref:Uncharacterized protein n=1 Tax=Puccinia graminis f. sp. tritici TaxID=56615 RepID=A0A5B0PVS6_PUCGR|nr:hypothetical protein PGT21_014441 [Puccinia graminis f. sp. tritici]KAA1104982.1 hypothetical protein PGTUg99_015241 [Puccinia graminis f. sp. tritici]